MRPRDIRRAAVVVVAALAAVAPAGAGQAAAPATDLVVRYGFDTHTAGLVDESGHGHVLHREASAGGTTRTVVHDSGRAVGFPRACDGRRCPRAVLQSPHRADLNPGGAPFAFGATLRLGRGQTTDGQNVVQKGYSTTGSQYKLQVDGAAGVPSCVLVGRDDPTIRIAHGDRTVADGRWHTIACRRSRTVLTIEMDGVARGRTRVPAGLQVVNDLPLSIGGKGAYQDNDQFRGAVDDVWLSVS